MEDSKLRSGDFLQDVDITIVIRSSQSDLEVLNKIMHVIVTSASSELDTEILLIEDERKVTSSPGKVLRVVTRKFYIQ